MTLSDLQCHSPLVCLSECVFVQLCGSWQHFNWHSSSRGASAIAELLVSLQPLHNPLVRRYKITESQCPLKVNRSFLSMFLSQATCPYDSSSHLKAALTHRRFFRMYRQQVLSYRCKFIKDCLLSRKDSNGSVGCDHDDGSRYVCLYDHLWDWHVQ